MSEIDCIDFFQVFRKLSNRSYEKILTNGQNLIPRIEKNAIVAEPIAFGDMFDSHTWHMKPFYETIGIFAINHIAKRSTSANTPLHWSSGIVLIVGSSRS